MPFDGLSRSGQFVVAFADGILDDLRLHVSVENHGDASTTAAGGYSDLVADCRAVVLHERPVSRSESSVARSTAAVATPRSNGDILADFRLERAHLRVCTLESRSQSHPGFTIRDCIRWNLILMVDAEATA